MVIEAIYLSLFLGLFIDQVAVPMHFCHQPIIPGVPQGVVDLESLGVLGLEGMQVVLGVHGGCATSGVWRDDSGETMDGGVGSCPAESIGVVLHVNGDIPSLLQVPSVFDLEWDEPGRNVLPELQQDSSFLCFVSPLVSLPLVEYRASWASSLLLSSSGVMSSCIASLQYSVFGLYFNGFFAVLGAGLVEMVCDFICSIKSCQDNGAVNGEAVARASGESWAGAVVNKLVAIHAAGPVSPALFG